MRLIDADALEREGWSLSRNRQVDAKTMVYEVKKPTDFPPIEPEQFNPCTVCQEFDCSGCEFRRR